MQADELRKALEGLKAEIESTDLSSGPVRERLVRLVHALEHKLEEPDDAEHHATLVEGLKEGIGQLEVEYPQTTALLNRIMSSLGGAGI